MGERAFHSEAALCDAFSAWARDGGGTREPWTVYPETGGFDLLLVNKHGHQLGIEAKLAMNAKVIAQAVPHFHSGFKEGPDWRGILVPRSNDDLAELAHLLGLVVFTPHPTPYSTVAYGFNPSLLQCEWSIPWFDWNPAKRIELPPMVPDLPAGVPAPVRLTRWKLCALKVIAHLEVHGTITAREVREIGVDPRRFCASDGWLVSEGGGRWSRGTNLPAFEQQHPAEYAQIRDQLKASEPRHA